MMGCDLAAPLPPFHKSEVLGRQRRSFYLAVSCLALQSDLIKEAVRMCSYTRFDLTQDRWASVSTDLNKFRRTYSLGKVAVETVF
jgi:hypothetical protein